jgi:hypothetical protein
MAADEEIIVKIKVDSEEAGKSLKQLKTEYREQGAVLETLTVGTKAYIDQLAKLGKTKDDISDLNTTIKSFNPEGKVQAFTTVVGGLASGFQAAQGAAALFGASTENVQKALLKVQAVMAFSEGIKGIIGLGDGFRNLNAVLGKTAIGQKLVTAGQWLWNAAVAANPIGIIIIALAALVAGIAIFVASSDDEAESQARVNEIMKEHAESLEKDIELREKRNKILNDSSKFELDYMKARGATAEEIFNKEKELDEQRMNQLWFIKGDRGYLTAQESKELLELTRHKMLLNAEYTKASKGELDKQTKDKQAHYLKHKTEHEAFLKSQYDLAQKALKEQEENDAKELENATALIERKKELLFTDAENAYNDAQKKLLDEYNATNQSEESYKAYLALKQKLTDDYNINNQKLTDEYNLNNQLKELENDAVKAELFAIKNTNDLAAQIALLEAQKAVELDNEKLTKDERALINEKYRQNEEKLTQESASRKMQAELDVATQSNNAMQGLSDLYFSIKKANLKKGSKEEKKAAKEQFEINKKLQIASASISAIQGVINALTAKSVVPEPYGTILKVASAVAIGISAAANIAKISATTFEGGGSGATSDTGGASSSGGGVVAPVINSPTSASTLLNADGSIKGGNQNKTPDTRVIVVESDITDRQRRISQIQENAKI